MTVHLGEHGVYQRPGGWIILTLRHPPGLGIVSHQQQPQSNPAVEAFLPTREEKVIEPHIDCSHWYGLKFADLDCPNQLPYLTAEECGQTEPKLTLTLDNYVTDWAPPAVELGGGLSHAVRT